MMLRNRRWFLAMSPRSPTSYRCGLDFYPGVWGCQPPTPRLSCNEEFDWNDRRVASLNKSFGCRLNSSIVGVGENDVYMTPPPFVAPEDARADFRWKVVRQHVNGFSVIDIVPEDEPHDRCFMLLDLAISLLVKEITELHRLVSISVKSLLGSR
jgi:hypothetical protein